MFVDLVLRRPDLVIRRLVLKPGEVTPWHIDPCRRFSIVTQGRRLDIEYRDTGQRQAIHFHPGLTGWDEPSAHVHRAINTGDVDYEEVVVFLVEPPGSEYQPELPLET